jgi:hypothetical protein
MIPPLSVPLGIEGLDLIDFVAAQDRPHDPMAREEDDFRCLARFFFQVFVSGHSVSNKKGPSNGPEQNWSGIGW